MDKIKIHLPDSHVESNKIHFTRFFTIKRINRNSNNSITCARCAEVGHDNKTCEKSECCINCRGDHPAYSRVCPKWIFEKEIQAVKLTNNITYPEARKLIESRFPSPGLSFTNIVKSNKKSCDASAQTSPTIEPSSHPKKSTRSNGSRCETRLMPKLTLFPPSSEPVSFEYLQP